MTPLTLSASFAAVLIACVIPRADAQLPPPSENALPTLVTKAQYIACLDEQEIVRAERDKLDARVAAHRNEIANIRVAQTSMLTAREKVDVTKEADKNFFNQQNDALNLRAIRSNQMGELLQNAESQLEKSMQRLNTACGNIAVNKTDKDAAIAERATRAVKP